MKKKKKNGVWVVFGLVFLLGVIFRFAYFQEIKANPFFREPVVDSAVYQNWALDIIRGRGMVSGTFRGAFFMSPGYPFFLAGIYLFGGDCLVHAALIQNFFGLLSIFLIYRIAARFFGRSVGLIALFTALFYGLFIFYEFFLLLASIYVFVGLVFLYVLLKYEERPSWIKLMIAGLLFGISTLFRPSSLLLLPFLLFWFYLKLGEQSPSLSGSRWLRFCSVSGIFLLLVSLPIIPVTAYNRIKGDDFNLVTFAGGPAFLLGNSSWSDGTLNLEVLRGFGVDLAEPREMFQKTAEIVDRALGGEAKPSQISRYCYRYAFHFIRTSPLKYLKLLFRKLLLFLNQAEIGNNYSYYFFKKDSLVLKICFLNYGLIAPFAFLGALLALKDWKKVFLLYAFAIQFILFALLFYVLSRYRFPVVPMMIIFASFGVWKTISYLREGRIGCFILAVIILIAGFSLSHLDLGINRISNPDYNLGVAFTGRGKYGEAIEAYRQCLMSDPQNYRARYNLGNIYYEQGEWDKAANEYREALAIKDGFFEARHNLANTYAKNNNFSSAIAEFRRLLEVNPDDSESHYNLSLIYRRMGKDEEAEKSYRRFWELENKNKQQDRGAGSFAQ